MILEGVVTTRDLQGGLNVAPMGPIVDAEMTRLRLRPFRTSTTYRNLKATGCGVFHVTDDVALIVRAALGQLDEDPPTFPAERIAGAVLRDACRWYEFEVESLDDSQDRTEIVARVVHAGRLRDFFGFHRARHAVIEAAILATRIHLTGRDEVLRQLGALAPAVQKTAGDVETDAFGRIVRYVADWVPVVTDVVAAARPMVQVKTGSRLHFGPLAVGAGEGRRFGGIGVMIDDPGVNLTVEANDPSATGDRIESVPEIRVPVEAAVAQFRQSRSSTEPLPPVTLSVTSHIPHHAGLGSGTQTALAVARGLAEWERTRPGRSHHEECETTPNVFELAARMGRGLRSGIGIGGFARGGFLIDAGKRSPAEVSRIVSRLRMRDWPFVLVTPRHAPGLSGAEERDAFTRLGPMPTALTDRLCRIALLDLAGSIQENDFSAASKALSTFGDAVGSWFAPVQGGLFAHPAMRKLAEYLRSLGIDGVGQSSWGPTLFAMTSDRTTAQSLVEQIRGSGLADECSVRIAVPQNQGASVSCTGFNRPVGLPASNAESYGE